MPTINSAAGVNANLQAGRQLLLSTTGEAYADVLAGAPGAGFDSFRAVPGRPRNIGPFGADAVLRIRATNGAATYDVVDPNAAASDGSGSGSMESGVIASIGDSITDLANNGYTETRSKGFMTWLIILSDGALQTNRDLNFGISGQTSKQVFERSASNAKAMRAMGARFCTVLIGTNDLNDATVTEKDIADNTAGICKNLLAEMITPILIPILPRFYDSGAFGTALTPARRLTLQRWANVQRAYARRTPGVMLYDPTLAWTDQSDNLGYPIGRGGVSAPGGTPLAFTNDGLHPAPRGAFVIGKGLWDLLKSRVSGYAPRIASQADVYDATYNPAGNRFPNGFMKGSVAQAGAGAGGVAATGVTIVRQGAGTGVNTGSKGTRVINGVSFETQVCNVVGVSSAIELHRAYITITGLTVGQLVNAEWALAISDVTPGSLTKMDLFANCNGTNYYANRGETGMYMPDDSWSGTLPIPQFTAGATSALVILEWGIDGTVANAGAKVEILRIGVKAVDP